MTADNAPAAPAATPPAPRRGPGHRGQDVRDAVAEMTARAHEISLEAGSKMAAAMKEVVHAAAGMAQFASESSRDLVHFMVRRGQMTADEAEKLLKEAEDFAAKNRRPVKSLAKPSAFTAKKAAPAAAHKVSYTTGHAPTHAPTHVPTHLPTHVPAHAPAAKKAVPKAAIKKEAGKPSAKKAAPKTAAHKKAAPKKAASKKSAHKPAAKKPAAKKAAKKK